MQFAGRLRGNELLDIDRADDRRAELEHLQHAARGQIGPAQSGRKADEVFDPRRAAGLAARPEPIEHQRRQAFGRGIDGGGNARRPGADDGQIDLLLRAMPPDAGLGGQLPQRRVEQHLSVAAFDGRRPFAASRASRTALAFLGLRVEPSEGDEVLVEKLADGVGVAAARRPDHSQADQARLREQLAAAREGRRSAFRPGWARD